MIQSRTVNRHFFLAGRPKGEPTIAVLRIETGSLPVPGPGQMLLGTEDLSLGPCLRARLSNAPPCVTPVALGAVMKGGTVGQVVSQVDGFRAGDRVLSYNG